MFKRVVIVSGPTVEPIDPVRFISNRSSGKSGFQLANEAKRREVEEIFFISGPTCYKPDGVEFISVETALEMREQVFQFSEIADVIIMAAAVGDFRVEHYSDEKIKKDCDTLTLHLVKNPDILFELGQRKRNNQVLIGYAAETDHIFENARKKFEKKNVDLLILNEVSARNPAFNAEENQVYFVTRDGIRKLEKLEKSALAIHIWDEIYKLSKTGIETKL